ncbi:MAG: hemolysin family protein [Dehalococcoidia bacterium]
MDPDLDGIVSIASVIIAASLLIIVTAAESTVIFVSRSRARVLSGRLNTQNESLHRYMRERAGLLSALRFGRNVAIILGTAAALHLALVRFGGGWQTLLLVALGALVAIGVIEGIPEMVGAKNPDRWAPALSPVLRVLGWLFWLPSTALDLPGAAVARLTRPPQARPEEEEQEELIRLVEMEESNGGIEHEERQMIRRVIKLVDTAAREIMTPRIDIIAVDGSASMADVQRIVVERGFSRIPLYHETIDNIVGVIYAKDVLQWMAEGARPPSLTALARPPYFIPETKKVDELLTELRQNKVHIAIVVDEYGGTAGLVTTEDILEEIVGEIEDEYDIADTPIEQVSDNEVIIDARVGIDALNELFDLELESADYDTVGGIVLTQVGRVPAAGDAVQVDGIRLHVLSVIGRRIKKVRVTRLLPQPVESS